MKWNVFLIYLSYNTLLISLTNIEKLYIENTEVTFIYKLRTPIYNILRRLLIE